MSDTDRIRGYFERTRWRPSSGRDYLVRERTRLLMKAAAVLNKQTAELRICDVGCGVGGDLAGWRARGVPESHLAGTELVEQRASVAQGNLPDADIRFVNEVDLPFGSAAFDICSASLVVSTIRSEAERRRLLEEMARVTAPGGMVAVYDFVVSKPWNQHVRAVSTRSLTRLWRRPDEVYRAAPFLPLLNLADSLPSGASHGLVTILPRTHRMWIWRMPVRDA